MTECSNDIGDYGGEELVTSVFAGMIDTHIYGKFHTNALQLLAYLFFVVVFGTSFYGILAFKKHKIVWYRLSSSLLLLMFALMIISRILSGLAQGVGGDDISRFVMVFVAVVAETLIGLVSTTAFVWAMRDLLPKNPDLLKDLPKLKEEE